MLTSEFKRRLVIRIWSILICGVALLVQPQASAQTYFIGDDAAEGSAMSGTGPLSNYSASSTTTFAFPTDGTTYKNTTNAVQQIALSQINFYAGNVAGSITPFVAIYSGTQAATSIIGAAGYNVMLIGDAVPVTGTPGVQNRLFTVNGGVPPVVNLAPGQTIVAGFVGSAASIVKYIAGGSFDYIALTNALPSALILPSALTANGGNNSGYDNTMKFNLQITVTSPALVYVGDDADEGSSLTDGTGSYSLTTPCTFDSVRTGTTYINTTQFMQRIKVSQINFYASTTGGTLTPIVAVYSGDQTNAAIESPTSYDVLIIGDPISVAANSSGAKQAQFLVGGKVPGDINLYPNEILTVGFMSSSARVVRCGPADATIDYVALSNTLPATVPNSFVAGTVSALGQKLKFNVGLTVDSGEFYMGDDAAEGGSVHAGNGNDNSTNPVTYDFVEPSTTWVNTTDSIEIITLDDVNFYSGPQSGTIIPFVSVYNGTLTASAIQNKANYHVVMIGAPIGVTGGSGAQNHAFKVHGDTPSLILLPNQALTAGYETTSGPVIQYSTASGGYVDHVDLGNTLPPSTGLPASFTSNSTLSLDRTLKFNVGFRVRGGNLKIVCIGDSITYGATSSDPTIASYPARLQGLLGSDFNVVNLGVSSKTLLHVLDDSGNDQAYAATGQYQQSLNSNPDIVVIQLGTNDSKQPDPNNWNSTTAAEFEPAYVSMIQTYRELSSVPVVIANTCPAVVTPAFSITNPVVTGEIVPLVRQAAGATECPVIDVNFATTKFVKGIESSDGVHPNDGGYRALANTVFTGLTGPQSPVSGATYELLGESTGKLVEVAGASTASGANLDIATEPASSPGVPATLASNQEWVLTQIFSNTYKIVNVKSNMVMDVGAATASGSSVVQNTYTGTSSQQWQIVNAPESGYFKLVNSHSGLALDVTGGAAPDGTVMQQVTNTTAVEQNFQLIPK